MNTDFNSLLLGPDYFRCEKLSCTIRKSVCIERRKATHVRHRGDHFFVPDSCVDCGQGAEIASGDGEPKVKEAGMDIFKKTCSKCGQEKPLEEFHINKTGRMGRMPVCKTCKCEYMTQLRAARLGKKISGQAPVAPPVIRKPASSTLTLNFEGYENVLEWLSRSAAENFRNPDQQALFVLHQISAAGNVL